jgi:hypothetical protein
MVELDMGLCWSKKQDIDIKTSPKVNLKARRID